MAIPRSTPLKTKSIIKNQSEHERIAFLTRQEEKYQIYWKPMLDRAIRNARMYWHVNFGMWPDKTVEKLRNEGRRPPTFPVIPDKLETLIGSFLNNGMDVKFHPIKGAIDSLVYKLQDMYLADKYNMDWEISEIQTLLDSFILYGAERMIISDAIDDFGNIAWENINPRHLLLDPCWKSNYIKDINNYFLWDYKTATQIAKTYSRISDKIKELRDKENIEGIDYGTFEGAVPKYKSVEEKWVDQHKVIEFHSVEATERKWEYDLKNNCWFPETGFSQNSTEDRNAKKDYILKMGNVSPDDIVFLNQKKVIKKVEIFCPTLNNETFLIESRDDIIQTDNCNIYPLGIRYNGEYMGIVDRLYDLNVAINKGEMSILDVQMRKAREAYVIDGELTGGDIVKEEEIKQHWNEAGFKFITEPGATKGLAGGGIVPIPSTNIDVNIAQDTARYYDLADRFSKIPAAQDARTESSKESGILYRYKMEVGLTGQKYLVRFYERHIKEKAESYIAQAKITYAGIPRIFGKKQSEDRFGINQKAVDLVTGQKVVLDDISKIPRMLITVTPSKMGINMRRETSATYAELLPMLSGPSDGLLRIIAITEILLNSGLDDAKKEEIEKASSLLKTQAALTTIASIEQMQGAITQMQQAQTQQQQPQEQQTQQVSAPNNENSNLESMLRGTTQESVLNKKINEKPVLQQRTI